MNKAALVKISFAMAVISLYTYVFGIMDIVDGDTDTDNTRVVSVSVAVSDTAESEPPPVSVSARRVPSLADYDAPVLNSAAVFADTYPSFGDESQESPESQESQEESLATGASTGTSGASSGTSGVSGASSGGTVLNLPPVTTAAVTTTATAATSGVTLTAVHTTPPPNSAPPETEERFSIRTGGSVIEGCAFDIVTRVVEAEVGASFHEEAIKAQAVAAYTYIKRHNSVGNAPTLPTRNPSDKVIKAAAEVWGLAVYFEGELIQAVFSASSAGYTSSALHVWGSNLPYLQSIRTGFDEQHDPNYGRVTTFTSAEIAARVHRETGITLEDDPADWIRILNRTDSVYVNEMTIGGQTSYRKGGGDVRITGRRFRESIMDFDLRSAAFTFEFDPLRDTFTFTSYGYGHGVGMAQNGANTLARHFGYNYIDILKFYYQGVTVE
jgi:stage II sporulation protein D